ncbi:MAG: cobyric acid synthase [Actinomycetota bacterium]|nr:cobyric acid synthase [Actinomycetota bacterium]
MSAKTLMIQGTGSDVGKSVVVAGLCRIFSDMGMDVAPFKAQNMALNSFVTLDGKEMGRAQAVQARAARLEPSVDFNPILLKPTREAASQVIVHGRPVANLTAREYHEGFKGAAKKAIDASLTRLLAERELIIIEGAGSPAEVNLKDMDIVNMAVAKAAKAPVILIGDIDKGGVLASLVGTLSLLEEDEKKIVSGLIINKFRGDLGLLGPVLDFLTERTKKPVLGVLPFMNDIAIEEEDSIPKRDHETGDFDIDVAIIRLPRISNFTDFDPLRLEEGVRLRYVSRLTDLCDPDVLIIPGSKNTLSDLNWLYKSGFAEAAIGLRARGRLIVGICGGLQMLGEKISDMEGIDGLAGSSKGLGLLPISTSFHGEKVTERVRARLNGSHKLFYGLEDHEFEAYEIHHGRTDFGETDPLFGIESSTGTSRDGMVSEDAVVFGTYLHGIFEDDLIRAAFLDGIRAKKGLAKRGSSFNFISSFEAGLNDWAEVLRKNLDMVMLEGIVKKGSSN